MQFYHSLHIITSIFPFYSNYKNSTYWRRTSVRNKNKITMRDASLHLWNLADWLVC